MALWTGIPRKQKKEKTKFCFLCSYPSPGGLQFLRSCEPSFHKAIDIGCHIPVNFPFHATPIPSGNGMLAYQDLRGNFYLISYCIKFAQVTSNIIEAIVSIKRLQSYLDADELQPDARTVLPMEDAKTENAVLEIKNGDFRWSEALATATLEDINLCVRKGEVSTSRYLNKARIFTINTYS